MARSYNGGSGCIAEGRRALDIDLESLMAGLHAEEPEGLWTRNELCERWGLGEKAVLRRLSMLKSAGRLINGKKRVETISGHVAPVDAYGFKIDE